MRRPHPLCVVGGLALCAWCGWVSGFTLTTTPAVVTWLVSLAAVVALDVVFWQGRPGRRPGLHLEPAGAPLPAPRRHGDLVCLSPWLAVAAVVLAWEVLGIDTGPGQPHLTISALTRAFRPMHAAMLAVWMGVGVGYGVARARIPVAGPAQRPSTVGRSGGALFMAGVLVVGEGKVTALLLPSNRDAGVVFWLGVVATAVIVDQQGRRHQRVATAEEALRLVTAPWVANLLAVAMWTYGGYHLFAH